MPQAAAAEAYAAANGFTKQLEATGQAFGPDNHYILHPLAVLIILHILCPDLSLTASLFALALGGSVGVGGTCTLYWASMGVIWAILAVRMLVESVRRKQNLYGPRAAVNGMDVATGTRAWESDIV